jgi:hypothetical protein
VTPEAVLKVVKLDLLLAVEVEEIAKVIGEWREEAVITVTPGRKKVCSENQANMPITQPSFIQPMRNVLGSGSSNQGK